MTREEAIARRAELERRRDALVDQIAAADAASASLSAGGGSKSYSSRSVAELKAKVAFVEREIARLDYRLGVRAASPDAPRTVQYAFNG